MALFFKQKGRKSGSRPADNAAPAHTIEERDLHGTPVEPADPELEQLTLRKSREFLENARSSRSSMLSAGFWSDKLMDWSMKDEAFKVQLFRFVDAFPMLRTPEQVHSHLVDYLSQPGVTPPPGFELGVKAGGLAKGLAHPALGCRGCDA